MAEVEKTLTLAEQWSLPNNEDQPAQSVAPVEDVTNVEKAVDTTSEDVVAGNTDQLPAAEESAPAAEEASETPETPVQEATEVEETTEETTEIKIETAPADFRFPTTNQTRHCFTRYIEYHRCVASKGEGAPECDKFAKYYRSLCPSEWVERWNEQRENGTFPGPL